MRLLAAFLALALTGCMTGRWDPHGPKTVFASDEGGAVTVQHGARLHIPLKVDPVDGYEWKLIEPQPPKVMAEGPPDAGGQNFTPVRSGQETLRLEYRPVTGGEAAAKRILSYDVTVPERDIFARMWAAITSPGDHAPFDLLERD